MAKAKIKPIVKSAAIDKAIVSAVETLNAACNASAPAVDVRAKEAKKLTAEGKRLAKKKAVLSKRKTAVSAKVKKDPSAANRKLLKVTVTELAAVTKASAKSRAAKSANAEELNGLKAGLKKAVTYAKLIEKARKVLDKPRKKSRKKRA